MAKKWAKEFQRPRVFLENPGDGKQDSVDPSESVFWQHWLCGFEVDMKINPFDPEKL